MQRRQRGANIGLLLLFTQIYQFGFNNIPPVTLATLGLNVFLFLNPLKPLLNVCISVQEGYYHSDWQRLLLSPFHHADDWHLYFNMVSLLWKGSKLERVLFALKVLNNHYHPGGSSNIFGLQVSNSYACWAELVAIHVVSPGTSFVGHLSGILVGVLYTHGPLKTILTTAATYFSDGWSPTHRNFNSSGYAGYSDYQYQQNRPPESDAMYTGGLNEEEQLQRAIRESLNQRGTEEKQLTAGNKINHLIREKQMALHINRCWFTLSLLENITRTCSIEEVNPTQAEGAAQW
ncbi:rhomboid-related protein 4 isoform X6 [Ascaphus truei]|uniref:rhomboid-related protein 4 isoform X6 n=1 Tax=Ascaphus truei TaxID=8439 RepID=UPI003F5971A0